MDKQEIVSSFISELRRGVIVLLVLSSLHTEQYGYSLITEIEKGGVSIEANTLYPLLRRLESQGLLTSTWNTDAAKPRKYYEITDFGRDVYETLRRHWHSTVEGINKILGD